MGPSAGFWVPGLGRSAAGDWNIEGGHLAERCGLFVIIALGESILVTGVPSPNTPWKRRTVAAFVAAFLGSVATWWIYFNPGAEGGSRIIAASRRPGSPRTLGLHLYAYAIVAGIIVYAVADELVLSHPTGHTYKRSARRHPRRTGALSLWQHTLQIRRSPAAFRLHISPASSSWSCWSRLSSVAHRLWCSPRLRRWSWSWSRSGSGSRSDRVWRQRRMPDPDLMLPSRVGEPSPIARRLD